MTPTHTFDKPMKPAEFAEKQLLEAILDGRLEPGQALPAERVLSVQLGVTRPTLREILQRLAKEGFVTIAHGKPTRVNDYLSRGGLGVLSSLVRHSPHLSRDLVTGLLEVRTHLMPFAAQNALAADPHAILDHLAATPGPGARPVARYDWQLQIILVSLAGNPVLKLMFNDFTPVYQTLGEQYFSRPKAVEASFRFYGELREAVSGGRGTAVRDIVQRAMAESQMLWRKMQCE